MQPAVNSVGNARQRQAVLAVAEPERRQLGSFGKVQLKGKRLKIAASHLRGKVEKYIVQVAAQPFEKVLEALAFFRGNR